jgi:hypothetical protein
MAVPHTLMPASACPFKHLPHKPLTAPAPLPRMHSCSLPPPYTYLIITKTREHVSVLELILSVMLPINYPNVLLWGKNYLSLGFGNCFLVVLWKFNTLNGFLTFRTQAQYDRERLISPGNHGLETAVKLSDCVPGHTLADVSQVPALHYSRSLHSLTTTTACLSC